MYSIVVFIISICRQNAIRILQKCIIFVDYHSFWPLRLCAVTESHDNRSKSGARRGLCPLHFPDKFSLSFRRLYARRRANQNLNRPEGNPHSFENCAPSNGNQRKVASLSLSSVHSSNISFVIIDGGADVSP